MAVKRCGSCGRLFVAGSDPWLVVDPGRNGRFDLVCPECERVYETQSRVFVYADPLRHVVTVLSDRGLRAARHDAARDHAR